ncbi:MAG: penicillin-binding protein activator LpoB [Spirochaetaceae bacterium 4572_59]|nr:MAG: penicillin-binding protein activator LpoB [Spirochaetaceae bacterium 4572_59]
MKNKWIFLILAMVLIFSGCASTKVSRTSTDEVIDLSGRWNDTDARLTAEELISDVLSRVWLENFTAREGDKPVVIVGTIRNKSSEHIETVTFVKEIEKELINSGKVRFVASKEEREEVREERVDQQSQSTEETAAALAAETGADFMLKGVITSITDAIEGKRVVTYKVDMELIDLESNEKVWIGSNEIKKFIKQSKANW